MTSIVSSSSAMPVNAENKIETTKFGVDFVLEHMRRVSGNADLRAENLDGIGVVDITGGSAFFARVLRVSFQWNDSQIEPKSVVLKIPTGIPDDLFGPDGFPEFLSDLVPRVKTIASTVQSEEETKKIEDSDHVYLAIAHTREVQFYKDFANRANGLRLPVFYYGFDRFSTTVNILPGLNNAQIEALIDELARLATLSWSDRSWVAPMIENPAEDQEEFLQQMRNISLELQKLDARFESLLEKMAPLYTSGHMKMSSYKEDKYGFPAALVHGDLWTPNVLWRLDENGEVSSELGAVIDWQSVHAGNPLEDFGRLLVLNTTSAYRRANHDRLLQLYIAKLREYGDGESPIHERNIEQAYKAAMPFVTMFIGFGVPMYCNMPSVVRQDPEHKGADTVEILDRTLCFFEEVIEAYGL
ncbi:hypothetical protein QR680_011732 [Steinernema hermaphroditum]|uniref:CHK kinase-like domain-containing protein n=1 Tax=Steinernema hermaphroditum TaxID=289476 RepID=A0AA39I1T3_9BILA|nr:hypothetical protein QR680_011732 [Steinernema hermaphroditum]